MAAPLGIAGDTIKPGMPLSLFQTRIADGGTGLPGVGQNWQSDVAPDGRFLINVNLEETSTTPITITQNWMPKP